MQLTKRSYLLLSLTVLFVVFSSMFYFQALSGRPSENIAPQTQSSVINPDLYIGMVRRDNIIHRYGYNIVSDQLTFVNNGSTPINYIYYTISPIYLSNFLVFDALTKYRSSLSYQEAQNGLFGYKTYIVYLNTPIFPEQNQTIVIRTTFTGLWSSEFDPISSNHLFTYQFTKFPFSPYPMYDIFAANSFPYRSFFTNYTDQGTDKVREEGTEIQYGTDALAPFTEELFEVEGRNNQYSNLEFTEITRRIYVNPWGSILVIENHHLKNTGDMYIRSFEYVLAKSAYNITMYDSIGTIDGGSFNEETGFYTVNLQNRAGINPNATTKYAIQYYLPLDEYFSRSYTISSLKMNLLLSQYTILIKNQNNFLYLYAGKSIVTTSITPDSIYHEDNSLVMYFHYTNVITPSNYYLFLEYKDSNFQLIARGLLFSGILIVAFSGYAVLRTRMKSRSKEEEIVREEVIPEAEMREFIAFSEEIAAIRIDIKKLDEDLSRKKIAKKAYTKQLKVLESKLKATQEEIKPFKKLILGIGGPIADLVKRLDLREAELISNQDSIKLYDERYKKGKLPSKQAYRTLRTQMEDNGEKIQRQIDRLINQMKAYLI